MNPSILFLCFQEMSSGKVLVTLSLSPALSEQCLHGFGRLSLLCLSPPNPKTGFLYKTALTDLKLTVDQAGHELKDPTVFASRVLGLKACTLDFALRPLIRPGTH